TGVGVREASRRRPFPGDRGPREGERAHREVRGETVTRLLLLTALFFAAAGAAAPAQSATEKDVNIQALQVRELQILRDGEVKFSESLAEFNKLLAQNPEHGTSARTRLQQLAAQLEDSAGELKSRFDFASRYPPNRDE